MRLAALFMAVLLLSGCGRLDPDHLRICRIVLPALHAEGVSINVQTAMAGDIPNTIIVRHETRRAPHPPQERVAECRFGGGRLSRERLELTSVMLDGRALSPASLHLLRRFWVDEPGTAALQPALSDGERRAVPEVSLAMALGLQHLLSALPQIAIYMLLAPAYALIYGLIGRINLAFGELAVLGGQGALLGAVGGAMLTDGAPLGMLAGALLLGLAAAVTHAEAVGRHVILPLAGAGGQPLLVATAGLSAALMEYVRLAQSDGSRWTPPLLNMPVTLARSGDFTVTATEGAIVFSVLAAGASVALLAHMRRSRFGREWRATSQEPLAAALMGVNTRAVLIRAMGMTGLLAGLAGFIMTAHYGGVGFSGGLGLGLKALIAAILGGIGSIGGAMVGALLLGGFEAAWASFLPIHLREAAVFSLLVLLLVFRPGGLLGYQGRDPLREGGLR
jgi:branched-chain amino acid transport system permease protein